MHSEESQEPRGHSISARGTAVWRTLSVQHCPWFLVGPRGLFCYRACVQGTVRDYCNGRGLFPLKGRRPAGSGVTAVSGPETGRSGGDIRNTFKPPQPSGSCLCPVRGRAAPLAGPRAC